MKTRIVPIVSIVCLAAGVVLADRMQELQQKFEARYPTVRQLKDAGKIGEVYNGLLEAVKPDGSAAAIVQEENADRSELYNLLAAKHKTTPAQIAERMATKRFSEAKAGDYLKGKDGQWKRK